MLEWVKVSENIGIKEAFIKKVKAGNRHVCLVGFEGKIYAVSAQCPHAGGELAEGWCKDGQIICPVHRYQYDLKTGRGAKGQGDYIDTFPVEVREDGIYVQVKKRWNLF
ncbi:Rieske (2Fe-2S) protein [Mucilaginibacter arboris]|uniref:Rieske 2Fe-2S domain-containing protein n=1 Tax=Mucilaginibacter arboris TaxID=2682090 RepID=A0A7K1STX5_9SPHI|nr:Rieske (2Fe-2S) protein [Mucilaginibacter arboris]MVN20771.1 Rieske 2Fe-2S domain-containing protein [Mucilaginibacter arboris]